MNRIYGQFGLLDKVLLVILPQGLLQTRQTRPQRGRRGAHPQRHRHNPPPNKFVFRPWTYNRNNIIFESRSVTVINVVS
jgi:hypothetical protein